MQLGLERHFLEAKRLTMTKMNKLTIAGWLLSVMLAGFFIMGAIMKLQSWEGKNEEMDKIGWKVATIEKIAFVEMAISVLFLIPQTEFLGAILLTGYMGGAIATHVRIGDPCYLQIGFGVLIWIAYWLRRPGVIRAAFSRQTA
jgi:hypothetical protein